MRFLADMSVALCKSSGIREVQAGMLSSELELAPSAVASAPSISIAQLSGAVHSRSVNCSVSS